jgi:hypothetical protein
MQELFRFVVEVAATAPDEDNGALSLEEIRKQIKRAALEANLDRSDGRS